MFEMPNNRRIIVSLVLAVGAVALVVAITSGFSQDSGGPTLATPAPLLISTSERFFRPKATTIVRPSCPDQDSSLQEVAVGVVAVSVAMSGRVLDTVVLDAPSPRAAAALNQAVRQWKFTPLEIIRGRPQVFSSKLTFYFVPRGNRCAVAFPEEAGFVGRRSHPSSVSP